MAAIAEGRVLPAIAEQTSTASDGAVPDGGEPGPVQAALVCRPAVALRELLAGAPDAIAELPERSLGVDQSSTSVVVGERVLLKAYRRVEAGLNPELELLAFLSEEARFAAVPSLAGYAEMVSASGGASTVAVAQCYEFIYASTYLPSWLWAPTEGLRGLIEGGTRPG